MLTVPILLRLARQLEAIWARRFEPWSDPWRVWDSFDSHLAGAVELRRKIHLAVAKNLTCAGPALREELNALLRAMIGRIDELRDGYASVTNRVPDRCEWIKELRHLEDEFGTVEVRWTSAVIRVVTDPIVLRDVYLGPFAIEFDWKHDHRSPGSKFFQVKALSPNVPSGRDDVTHPHVQDDILCAGDARDSLDQAVADGRFVDAFLIVRSVLTTYNGNSAYVPLGEWDGVHCAQCGRRVASSETSTCEGCECTLCDECVDRCEGCDEARCGDCLSPCDVCRARHCRGEIHTTDANRDICPNCLSSCSRCGAAVPKDELTADRQLCSTCNSPEEPERHDEEPVETTAEEVAVPVDAG